MPSVTPPPASDEFNGRPDGLLTANTNFAKRMSRFLDQGSLLSWNMGGSLSYDQFKAVSRSAQAFHAVDPMRPIAVDVSDGCLAYSRGVEPVMLGIHRFPLSTGMELTSYRDLLTAAATAGAARRLLLDVDSDARAGLVPGDGLRPRRQRRRTPSRSGRRRSRSASWPTRRSAAATAASASGPTASWPTRTPAATGSWPWPCSTRKSRCWSRFWRKGGSRSGSTRPGRRSRRPSSAPRRPAWFCPCGSAMALNTCPVRTPCRSWVCPCRWSRRRGRRGRFRRPRCGR